VEADAHLLLVSHGATLPCRIVDLSLTGCRLCTKERFPARAGVRVEVTFKVRGLAFRFCGTAQWTDGHNLVGIRFVDVSPRRKEEFLAAISEVEAQISAQRAAERKAEEEKAAQEAAEDETAVLEPIRDPDFRQSERPAQQLPAVLVPADATASQPLSGSRTPPVLPLAGPPQSIDARPAGLSPVRPSRRERRALSREAVDTSAVIYLIHVASRLVGRILDLSMGGCRIRTDERFPVGIYTRVETEFRLEGMPFRLGGVTQAIHDQYHIGIRFLDMSSRKREQLEQLIEELEELKGGGKKE
jgi:c-di-GMP-binding flagellar brake protein YcgR